MALRNRALHYEQSLWGGIGLFYASNSVERHEWSKYVGSLQIDALLPGINGIGYIDYVLEENLPIYLEEARKDGTPDFQNHPSTNHNDKFVIRLIEPIEKNTQALGLDIGFEANRRAAAEEARDRGIAVLTKKITLVQDNKKEPGFLLLIPTYETKSTPESLEGKQKHFLGWVYAPFIGSQFMSGLSEINHNELHFHVYDGENTDPENIIYSTDPDSIGIKDFKGLHKATTSFEIAERIWTIEWMSSDQFETPSTHATSIVVLAFGFLFSAMLYFTLNRLVQSQELISKEVKKRTKELADAQHFQELIMSNIPDLLFVKDDEFKIVAANPSFMEVYPQDMRDKVIGYTTLESYDDKEVKEFLKFDRQALEEGYSETEETISFPNGEIRTLFTKKVKFENIEGDEFILGVGRDISDIKQKENELERSNKELDDFAYIASHDLKEPLRGIHNHARLLKEDYETKLDDDGKHKIDRMMYLTQRMEKLINDLLYYSRLGRSEDEFEDTDLNAIVADTREILADHEDVSIKIKGTLPSISCERVRVTEMFRNLITNSVKYNESKDKQIEIGVKNDTTANRSDGMVFYVKDNGIGIDSKFHTDIFKIFKRLHKKDAYGGGTGSGLTFVKKIIEKHNGHIWVESVLGEGTTFYFTLPSQK